MGRLPRHADPLKIPTQETRHSRVNGRTIPGSQQIQQQSPHHRDPKHSSFRPKVPGTGWLYRRVLSRFIERCARGLAAYATAPVITER